MAKSSGNGRTRGNTTRGARQEPSHNAAPVVSSAGSDHSATGGSMGASTSGVAASGSAMGGAKSAGATGTTPGRGASGRSGSSGVGASSGASAGRRSGGAQQQSSSGKTGAGRSAIDEADEAEDQAGEDESEDSEDSGAVGSFEIDEEEVDIEIGGASDSRGYEEDEDTDASDDAEDSSDVEDSSDDEDEDADSDRDDGTESYGASSRGGRFSQGGRGSQGGRDERGRTDDGDERNRRMSERQGRRTSQGGGGDRRGGRAGGGGGKRVRYAVVGIGHIAQEAVLPAFQHAKKNSELVAIVSSDPEKREELGERYDVLTLDYRDYPNLLASGDIDAVYIATPNSEHVPFAIDAAEHGIHVLCEKPLAVNERDCLAMIRACESNGVHLMTAYRLHFEAANLKALELVEKGELGDPRVFSSVFTMQVEDEDNIRLSRRLGGGPLHDIGIYCINAARTLFRSEPVEVFAWAVSTGDPRFDEVEETVSATLRFPDSRIAQFTCSFGAADVGAYTLVGTEGSIELNPAYEYHEGLAYCAQIGERTVERETGKRDQFAAELVYFSNCVLNDEPPEPSGWEGLADVRVINALQHSLRIGGPVMLGPPPPTRHPKPGMRIDRPPVRKQKLVNAEPATGD